MDENTKVNLKYGQLADMVNRIEQIPPLTGTGAPTTSTPAWYIGQRYIDTQTNNEYYCVEIPSSGVIGYVWQPVDTSTSYTGGDGINIDAQNVISATNTGKVKVLTVDDYNANSNDWTDTDPTNFNCIAMWKLDAGVYNFETGLSGTAPTVYLGTQFTLLNKGPIWVGEGRNGNAATRFYLYQDGDWRAAQFYHENGAAATNPYYITINVVNNLTSTSTTSALSAKQGKVLKDLVDSIAIRGAGAPTTSTVSSVGTLYEDTTNGDLYICTDATNPYVWKAVGGGGGIKELTSSDYDYPTDNPTSIALWSLPAGDYYASSTVSLVAATPTTGATFSGASLVTITGDDSYGTKSVLVYRDNGRWDSFRVTPSTGAEQAHRFTLTDNIVVQTTGTSTTNVMSQNAVTSMVFADPSTRRNIQIGYNSTSGNESVAIGRSAGTGVASSAVALGDNASCHNNAHYGVALGAYSRPTQQGQVDISTLLTTNIYGYNNSQYRLLTGLYDPQSDHDAANKIYVDTAINTAIGSIIGMRYEVLSELPQYGELGVIYLIPSDESDPENVYIEYLWIEEDESGESGALGHFEIIGSTEIDLSNYVTTTELTTELQNYATTSDLAYKQDILTAGTGISINSNVISANIPATFTTNEWNALWA